MGNTCSCADGSAALQRAPLTLCTSGWLRLLPSFAHPSVRRSCKDSRWLGTEIELHLFPVMFATFGGGPFRGCSAGALSLPIQGLVTQPNVMQNTLLLSHIYTWDRMSLFILTALFSCVTCGLSPRRRSSQIRT